MAKVAIIGGGIAGVSTALALRDLYISATLFESNNSLVSGPPFCHLHAGGNLYPDITDKERIQLLHESIEFLQTFPYGVDFRPTVIAFPKRYSKSPIDFIATLDMLKVEYGKIVSKEPEKRVLGEVDNYYKAIYREDLEKLAQKKPKEKPQTLNDWLIPVAKYTNLDQLQFPIFAVQEYGLNMFRVSAGATLALQKANNINLLLETKVTAISKSRDKFIVTYQKGGVEHSEEFDFLVNAAGFNSGTIDDILGFKKERLVEFKAAYVTKWQSNIKFPEIIFHGDRGSDEAMAQFTPYANGYYQLHGMTKNITLFEDGLVKTDKTSAQPKLDRKYIAKIYQGWSQEDIDNRTQKAIEHISPFLPKFGKEATVASKPLFGAQQIPGCNINLRATEVDFINNYARCEIVKVSSALTMAKEIAKKLKALKLIDNLNINFETINNLNSKKLESLASKIASQRGYPEEMGLIVKNYLYLTL